MQVEAGTQVGPVARVTSKTRLLLDAIKFEHTIFALPFAYLGMVLAARDTHGWPGLDKIIWITLAMVGARTVAMGLNRLVDASMDALNPRTANRALPKKLLRPVEMLLFTIAAGALLAFSAYQLNSLCFKLVPLAAVFLVGYSYTKRFTWLCHLFLGITDGIAPIGGWLAVNPAISAANLIPPLLLGLAVACWVGGFDIIYACQDIAFDRAHGIHSLPARFGPVRALQVSELMHGISIGLLAAVGGILALGGFFWVGVAVAAWLLIVEHRLVNPQDFSKLDVAFFNINSYISLSVFVCTLLSVLFR
ncbi:MAG: 4-hydroxybenzoate octaprenyltransferase [Ktedonobacterales bacterium]|jgi:4-hydroxybenzoate polyprenyltransferase|nr:MAG: 4-hydroxybenzoate octaprenyltransferase [Ktedonobacterales bacterium]